MIKARSKGKRAYLVRDKMFVNSKEFTPRSGQDRREGCELSIVSWNVDGLKNSLTDSDFVNFVKIVEGTGVSVVL